MRLMPFDTSKEPGYLYFIEAEKVNRVKIGVAVSISKRLRDLRPASPVSLSVYGFKQMPTWNKARSLEQQMHRELGRWRVHGEWFELSKEVRDRIEAEIEPFEQENMWLRKLGHNTEERILKSIFSDSYEQ